MPASPRLLSSLIRLTGNAPAQRLLERGIALGQHLMGIGAGGSPTSSGESAVFDLLRRRAAPPYVVFDVGANRGQFLDVALAELAGTDFIVHCFEPSDAAFAQLSARPRGPHVVLNAYGLADQAGTRTLYADAPGSGLGSLARRRLDHFGIHFDHAEQVAMATLDSYCAENGVAALSLLKVDVEGYELDVFAGAERLFAQRAVDLVTFEFGGCNLDSRTSFRDFWYFFVDAKMDLARITPSGYFHPLHSYQEIDEQYRTTNFIAVRAR